MAIIKIPELGLASDATNLVLLSSQTASAVSEVIIEFTGSYKEYLIKFSELNPSVDNAHIQLNFSKDSGANYDATKNQAGFKLTGSEAGVYGLAADSTISGALTTNDVDFIENLGNAANESASGEIKITNPSSTTFHKIYETKTVFTEGSNQVRADTTGGYIHEHTTAISHIKIKPNSGTMDGTFTLYGVKT